MRTAKSGNDILRKKNLRRMTTSRRYGTTCPPFFIHRIRRLVSLNPAIAQGGEIADETRPQGDSVSSPGCKGRRDGGKRR